MKKVYIIEKLDCANCAAKIETKFNSHPSVEEATITFATRQLRLTAKNPDKLIPELTEIARTVEGEVVIRPRDGLHTETHHHDHECGCGHHHDHDHACGCRSHHEHEHGCCCGHHHDEHNHEPSHDHGHDQSGKPLLIGAGLFAAGLILGHLGLDWIALTACLIAYVILGKDVVMTAVKNLTRGHVFDENFLMSIATIGAFCIGEAPEAVGVMLFYRIGEYFEH